MCPHINKVGLCGFYSSHLKVHTREWIAGKRVSQGMLSSELIAALHSSIVTLLDADLFANEHSCCSSSAFALFRDHVK